MTRMRKTGTPSSAATGVISVLGLLLGTLALNIRVSLNFAVIFGLGLLAVVGLSRLVRQLWR